MKFELKGCDLMAIKENGFKICACCKIEKPISEFGNLNGSGDGLNYNCKDCVNKKAKIKRQNFKKKNPILSFDLCSKLFFSIISLYFLIE